MGTEQPTRIEWLFLALFAVSAAIWWILDQAEAPADGAPERYALQRVAPPPKTSHLTLPVTVQMSDLAQTVQAQVPEVVIELEGEPVNDNWAADLKVTRPADVKARGQDGKMILEIPLSVNARAWRTKKAERRASKGKNAPEGLGVDFDAVLELAMALELDDAWSLTSQTEIGVRWIDPPTLDLGPIKVPVRKPIEKALIAQLADIAAKVDQDMAERDDTRQAVERAWASLSAPRQVQEEPSVWLIGTPQALYASDLQVDEDRIELAVGYRGTWQTVLGEPGAAAAATPLPSRSPPPDDSGFELAIPTALQWEALSQVATANLTDQEWTLPGASAQTAVLKITEIELYPNGERVAVRVDYHATHPGWETDGTVYLTGIPSVDLDTRSVAILEFAYVLETWDTTVASANALVESGLEKAISERLVFPYGAALDDALAQTNQGLAGGQTTQDGGTLTGHVHDISVGGVTITDQALVIETSASGDMALTAAPKPKTGTDFERPKRPKRRGLLKK